MEIQVNLGATEARKPNLEILSILDFPITPLVTSLPWGILLKGKWNF